MSDNQQQASDSQTGDAQQAQPQGPTVNFPKLLDLCGGLLGRLFFELPKERSKELFLTVKKGEQPVLGELTLGEQIKLNLKLELNYSEFIGPGFNFDVFRIALKNLLERLANTLKLKGNLSLRTNQQGEVLVGFAGLTKVGEQHNALMMIVNMGVSNEVTVRLIFVDPSQFETPE